MLAFLTGFGFGAAAGWFTYVRREWLIMILLVNGGMALTVFFFSVVMPTSSAAGSLDMNLWQFTLYAMDLIANDFLASALVWFVVGFVLSNIVTWIAYQGFEPEPEVYEPREVRRRRIEAEMRYKDSYFD